MSTFVVHVDDIVARTNAVQSKDLVEVLYLTPPRRRIDVALAFLGWTCESWADAVGITPVNVGRWIRGENRIPYGGALRLSRVMGIPCDLLFEHWQ